jgi:NAD(P)-dependent dehydrogenase (short-subunit alcohol dehydrogenase family)
MLDIDAQRMAQESRRLQSQGVDVRGEVVDVTDHAALDQAIDSAAATYGRFDVVFAVIDGGWGPGAAD